MCLACPKDRRYTVRVISPDVLSATTYGYQTAVAFGLTSSGGHRDAKYMTLCPKFLGMSQVTTQVSETEILDALVTGHAGVRTARNGTVSYDKRLIREA